MSLLNILAIHPQTRNFIYYVKIQPMGLNSNIVFKYNFMLLFDRVSKQQNKDTIIDYPQYSLLGGPAAVDKRF